MKYELYKLYSQFLEYWIPLHPRTDGRDGSYYKPDFTDFMEWLGTDIEKELTPLTI